MKMMRLLLFLFLALSFVFSSLAVRRPSGTLKSDADYNIHPSLQEIIWPQLTPKGVIVDGIGETEDAIAEGRKMIELTDYPGTGANNQHNPKPPGTV